MMNAGLIERANQAILRQLRAQDNPWFDDDADDTSATTSDTAEELDPDPPLEVAPQQHWRCTMAGCPVASAGCV